MSKGSEILSRLVGAGSMFASMIFFGQMGGVHEYLIPGVFFGVSGIFMVLRRGERRAALPDLDTQQRLAQLSEGLSATQQELVATQERLDRLTEERDFLRQLATPPRVRPATESPRPPELPGTQPRAADSAPPA